MSHASYGVDRFTTGFPDVIIKPRIPAGGPVVVYLHTASEDGGEAVNKDGFSAVNPILCALADVGYTVVSPTQPPTSFGNGAASPAPGDATAQGRIHDAITYARASLGCNTKPVVLIGASMGSTAALRYAMLNPTLVACVVTVLTVADLTDIYANNWSGFTAFIGTAYGVTSPTPLPSTADPYTNRLLLKGIPGMLHHSSDDQFSTGLGSDNPIATFCADTGMTEVNVGALGHTNASIGATNIPNVLTFVRKHT